MSATFTPAPWIAERQNQTVFHVESEDFGRVVTVHEPTQPKVAQANAHLIAAAPDLYAALVEADIALCQWVNEKNIGSAEYNRRCAVLDKRDAALAKARGEK